MASYERRYETTNTLGWEQQNQHIESQLKHIIFLPAYRSSEYEGCPMYKMNWCEPYHGIFFLARPVWFVRVVLVVKQLFTSRTVGELYNFFIIRET